MSGLAYTSGHIIGARYRLLSRLGAGGMGEVWQAEHLTLKSPVAIKFINPALAASGDVLQRFMREAQSSAALRSTHIVQVFDFGVDNEVPYIAMELLHGESLGDRLQRELVLTPAATGVILTHVARAMAQAHEAGVVHRDLKPDNVFIVKEHDTEIAKVLDFGVAKVTGGGLDATTGGGTKTGAILGTPFYVSPEQARGNKAVDFRSDLWALGVITYECVTGRRPFESDGLGDLLMQICGDPHPPPSTVASVPHGFDQWMDRALHKDPEQRFTSAQHMAEAFQALLSQGSQLPVTAQHSGQAVVSAHVQHPTAGGAPTASGTPQGLAVTNAPVVPVRRSLAWLAIPGVVGLLALVGTGTWWVTSHSTSPELAASASPAGLDESIHPKPAAQAPAVEPASVEAVPAPRAEPPAPSPAPTAEPPATPPPAAAKPKQRAPVSPKASPKPEPTPPKTASLKAASPKAASPKVAPPAPSKSERDLFEDRL